MALFSIKKIEKSSNFAIKVIFLTITVLSTSLLNSGAVAADERKKIRSGETQVIAKIGKREVTISELRVEMARLGLSEMSVQTEQFALQSIINRHLLIHAARKAGMHRKPEAALRVKAAQEQALADFYLGAASQPPEPTLAEVEDYITQNPGLFAHRKRFTFSVLTLATRDFNADLMTPLFSETDSFADLEESLKKNNMAYVVKPLVQVSSSFPTEIRQQLGRYTVNDNIVIKSEEETQIMKIIQAVSEPVPADQWATIARRIVIEESAVRRARSLVDSLKVGKSVVYYREGLAPIDGSASASGNIKKGTGK